MPVANSPSLILEQPGDTGAQGMLSVFCFPRYCWARSEGADFGEQVF